MNKDLDRLFDQTRQSLKSDMPLKEVQQLIHAQASPSLWTNQKFWIMNSFIGIISISSLLLWNSYNKQNNNNPIANHKDNTNLTLLNKNTAAASQFTATQVSKPDELPSPKLQKEPKLSIHPIASLVATPFPGSNPTLDLLDSLGPKKTFTEYKLEIKKENSEREIKKLKSELASYGIHMEIKELTYNDENKIKRFKGKFKTDSLFCGSTMSDYEFDISGSFQSMEFVFRVADDKNLKYLKIQSDDFEETIECYDDEVIANTQEAKRMREQMKMEINRASAEMDRARAEMDRAQAEMDRARAEMEQQKAKERFSETNTFYYDDENPFNWQDFNKNLKEALKDVENIDHNLITEEVQKALKKYDNRIFDKEFRLEMKKLEKEMEKLNYDIDIKVRNKIKAAKDRQKERRFLKNDNTFFEEDASSEELEKEAKELEKAAKELRKKAKQKAKEEKKKK